MRIIAGTYRSRQLQAPAGMATRPSSDRLRETLFNVLAPRIEGAHFLDLYAGSGAVGLEALSRGAAHVAFVEHAEAPLKSLRANLASLDIKAGFRIHASSMRTYLRKASSETWDIVFLDPPWDAADEYQSTLAWLGRDEGASFLNPDALVIAEHRRKDRLADSYGRLARTRLLEQGDAALSFYAIPATAAIDTAASN
jgi:16S rRNA (guanine(966)-N(2))-methyltransferase RsmD